MINPFWLGQTWDVVEQELKHHALPYSLEITQAPGYVQSWGNYRIVRLREHNGCLNVVLAYEKFSVNKARPPKA